MQEEQTGLRSIDYRQVFPWVHLFRAFRIAIDVRKIILASLGLVVLAVGNWAFLFLPFAPDENTGFPRPWDQQLGYNFEGPRLSADGTEPAYLPAPSLDVPTPIESLITDPRNTLWGIGTNWAVVLRPLLPVIEPARELFRSNETWGKVAYAWTRLLWAIVVWSLFAGALTRMAAVQFARNESVGLAPAIQFSGGKFLSYVSAPLLPVGGIILCWLACLVAGLIGRIPAIGDTVVGFLGFIPLLFGLLMALLLLGVAAGWPLMLATVSTEGTDAFDGFSRSYGYVYSRPWQYLWLSVLTLAYGSAVIFVVWIMVSLVASLTNWGVAAGMGAKSAERLFESAPSILQLSPEAAPIPVPDLLMEDAAATTETTVTAETTVSAAAPNEQASEAPSETTEPPGSTTARQFMGVWLSVLGLLVNGFVYSYFWCAVTIVYFLLRKSDDATALDEVYLLDEEEEDDLLPVVGVADSQHAVVERPPGVISPEQSDASAQNDEDSS